MTTGYDIEIMTDNQYGFHFDHVIKELAKRKGALIGDRWDVGQSIFECPGGEEDSHDEHEWVFLTVTMLDGKDAHDVTLHRENIEREIDRRRLSAWENLEPAWPHVKGQS